MSSSRKEVYPVSEALREDMGDYMKIPAVEQIVDAVGEYEHGSADVEDVFPVLYEQLTAEKLNVAMDEEEEDQIRMEARLLLLRAYAAVAADLGLTIGSQS